MFRLNRNKQKTHPNSLKVSIFFRKFRVVSVCFGLLRNSSVCFDIGSKHRNKPKSFGFGFTKQTETNAKQILFWFVSVRTEIYFCLFRGHPSDKSETTSVYGIWIEGGPDGTTFAKTAWLICSFTSGLEREGFVVLTVLYCYGTFLPKLPFMTKW